MAMNHYKGNATLMSYTGQSLSLVNGLTELVNIDRHELSRISTFSIGHDVSLGHDVNVLGRKDGNRLNRGMLRGLLLRVTARFLLLAARVELNVIVEVSSGFNHHDELTSKNDAASNREDDNQEQERRKKERKNIRRSEVEHAHSQPSIGDDVIIIRKSNLLDVLVISKGDNLGLIIGLVMHLVLHLLVLIDMDPGEEHNKGENSEEEDDDLNELEDPVEADHANVAVGSSTEADIEDNDVDERIHEHNERH